MLRGGGVTDLANVTVDDFAAHVGEVFATEFSDAGRFELVLAEATPRPGQGGPGAREPFVLHFHGPAEPVIAQRIYHLVNDGMGALDIFIVPIAQDAEKATYEAVFA
jgi:hypothetical protein